MVCAPVTSMNETKANIENDLCSCDKHECDESQYRELHVLLWQAWMRRKPILKMTCAPVTSMNETIANIENDMCYCDTLEWDESQYWKWNVLLWQTWMRQKPILIMVCAPVTSKNDTKANIENGMCSCDKHEWDESQYWKWHVLMWQAWMRRKPILKMVCAFVTSMNETKANIENDIRETRI